jgi:hypothetical protein
MRARYGSSRSRNELARRSLQSRKKNGNFTKLDGGMSEQIRNVSIALSRGHVAGKREQAVSGNRPLGTGRKREQAVSKREQAGILVAARVVHVRQSLHNLAGPTVSTGSTPGSTPTIPGAHKSELREYRQYPEQYPTIPGAHESELVPMNTKGPNATACTTGGQERKGRSLVRLRCYTTATNQCAVGRLEQTTCGTLIGSQSEPRTSLSDYRGILSQPVRSKALPHHTVWVPALGMGHLPCVGSTRGRPILPVHNLQIQPCSQHVRRDRPHLRRDWLAHICARAGW